MRDGFSCILDFPKFSEPPYKGSTSVKPSKSFFNNNSSHKQQQQQQQQEKKKKKKKAGKPSPFKTIYKKFIF